MIPPFSLSATCWAAIHPDRSPQCCQDAYRNRGDLGKGNRKELFAKEV
jgi:hypothetical protein